MDLIIRFNVFGEYLEDLEFPIVEGISIPRLGENVRYDKGDSFAEVVDVIYNYHDGSVLVACE